jgi:hypothetical protein
MSAGCGFVIDLDSTFVVGSKDGGTGLLELTGGCMGPRSRGDPSMVETVMRVFAGRGMIAALTAELSEVETSDAVPG